MSLIFWALTDNIFYFLIYKRSHDVVASNIINIKTTLSALSRKWLKVLWMNEFIFQFLVYFSFFQFEANNNNLKRKATWKRIFGYLLSSEHSKAEISRFIKTIYFLFSKSSVVVLVPELSFPFTPLLTSPERLLPGSFARSTF